MPEKLQELINQANDKIAENSWESAVKILNEACGIDKHNNEILKNLGLCYYNLGKNTKAQEFFTKALGVNPDDATSLFYAGAINLINLDLATAQTQLERVIELRPEYAEAYKNLGVLYFNQKQNQKAAEVLERGLEFSDESVEYVRLLASAYIVSGQNDKTISLLEDYIARTQKETYEVYNLLGSAYLGVKNHEKARICYLKSVTLNEKNEAAQRALAFLDTVGNTAFQQFGHLVQEKAPVEEIVAVADNLYRQKNINDAIAFLAYAINNGYDDSNIFFHLSILYEAKGHYNDSLKCLHKIISTQKPTREIEVKIAKLFLQLGKINEAFSLLAKLVKKYPYDSDVYYEYAMAYIAYGDNIKAEEYLKKVIAMDPESKLAALAHKDMGCIYLGQNNMDYAKDEFKMAYELCPDDDLICYEYASYFFISGDYETALHYYEKAIKINPHDDEFKVALALLYNNLKRYSATINLLIPILPQVHRMPKLAYPLAVAFYETGQFDLAQKLFISYCELTQDTEVYNMLALTYEKQGNFSDALRINAKILKEFPENINLLVNKARLLHRIERHKESEDIYLEVLSKLSNFEEAILGLVELYRDSNQLHKAKDLVARLDMDDFSDEAVGIFNAIKQEP